MRRCLLSGAFGLFAAEPPHAHVQAVQKVVFRLGRAIQSDMQYREKAGLAFGHTRDRLLAPRLLVEIRQGMDASQWHTGMQRFVT
jgi:hypothetical protein